jgi:hypothetical protein
MAFKENKFNRDNLKMKKIKNVATLTLPLHHNYGGLIQAFALQTFLKKNGYDSKVINIDAHSVKPLILSIAYRLKAMILNKKHDELDEISGFPKRYIDLTNKIYSLSDWKRYDINAFDAYIVGSDQVWRADYANNIECFYFNEIERTGKVLMSYAASLGFDDVRYNENTIKSCAQLLKNFKAVSLRESEAIHNFSSKMGVSASSVLDPTMLLEKDDYEELIEQDNIFCKDKIFSYILDKNNEKTKILDYCQLKLNVPYYIFNSEGRKRSMNDWLSGFKNSSFIVTDSFHGVVFSIIYRKQFIAIGNASRGLSRFVSLLGKLNLSNRLVLNFDESKNIDLLGIDYAEVKKVLNKQILISKKFLLKNLES